MQHLHTAAQCSLTLKVLHKVSLRAALRLSRLQELAYLCNDLMLVFNLTLKTLVQEIFDAFPAETSEFACMLAEQLNLLHQDRLMLFVWDITIAGSK
jgi:hypothetical protein